MEKGNSFDIVISTCGNYSDLWDANIQLLNQNWPDRSGHTYLLTDDIPSEQEYDHVEIISGGHGTEITQRLQKVLALVRAEYVVFLLDDYFLTERIDNQKILRAIAFMDEEQVDYLRLVPAGKHYLKREKAEESANFPGYFHRDILTGDYIVQLTPGLWRADFMRATLRIVRNAWLYEVSLTQQARDYGASCALSNMNEIPYLDVIRKGKVLRKAAHYFETNPIYHSERKVMHRRDEWKLAFRTFLRHWLPKPLFKLARTMMIKAGHHYYSTMLDEDGCKE